ncbi:hypothetical protein GCM10023324_58620 [Streptomyces youssoufiensis]
MRWRDLNRPATRHRAQPDNGPAGQRTSGPADQRTSGPADERHRAACPCPPRCPCPFPYPRHKGPVYTAAHNARQAAEIDRAGPD